MIKMTCNICGKEQDTSFMDINTLFGSGWMWDHEHGEFCGDCGKELSTTARTIYNETVKRMQGRSTGPANVFSIVKEEEV